MTIRLTLPPPISANRYWRTFRNRTVVSAEAKTYKTAVGWIARAAVDEPITQPITITLHWFRPAKRGDVDNAIKVTLDALNGIVYADDSQVVELHAYRHDDKHNPRVEVEVSLYEPV